MRIVCLVLFCCLHFCAKAQPADQEKFFNDSIVYVNSHPQKGFHHGYILFIPKGTRLHRTTVLLVEPNNTGKITDSMEVHRKYAVDLASVSSVGNNISIELKIPLLVPVFPRPASQPLMYTHALDRDVMLQQEPGLKRLDLQLLSMIKDAKERLLEMKIPVEDKFFMNGFSASATFTNRFSFIHPEKIKALAIGGFNGSLMLPHNSINTIRIDYPLGTADFPDMFGKVFDMEAYRKIPQYIYMGKLDDNDAVQFDDAYSDSERNILNEQVGKSVQERYLEFQKLYAMNNIRASFTTFDKVGHWTNSEVNLSVIMFFLKQMQ